MISANELTKTNSDYQDALLMIEERIKEAAAEKKTRVVIGFRKYSKYGRSIVAELQQNGYLAEVVYQNTSQGGGINLHVNWNRDTSQPVTWWEQFKHGWL